MQAACAQQRNSRNVGEQPALGEDIAKMHAEEFQVGLVSVCECSTLFVDGLHTLHLLNLLRLSRTRNL